MIRKSSALWRGTGRDGKGVLTSQSGVLAETSFGYKSRFEDGPGTNPEELLAAAHAACFAMAVAFNLQSAGFTPTELQSEAAVSLEPEAGGFKITRSALTLRATIPGIDEATFQQLAHSAENDCPVSKVLKAEITLAASLVSS